MLSVLTFSVKAFENLAVKLHCFGLGEACVQKKFKHFTFVLTVCILCQSNKKCVNCIAYTNGCYANCVTSLGKLLKVLKKTVII